jgi:hypothetical protein
LVATSRTRYGGGNEQGKTGSKKATKLHLSSVATGGRR